MISLRGVFKYTRTWIGNEYRIMYTIYYTRTNQKEGYGNTLTYMIIYCLYPSPSNPTTFNEISTHNVVHIVDLPFHRFLKLLLNIRTKGGVRLRNDRAAADRRLITVLGHNIPDLV